MCPSLSNLNLPKRKKRHRLKNRLCHQPAMPTCGSLMTLFDAESAYRGFARALRTDSHKKKEKKQSERNAASVALRRCRKSFLR
mmetsp:Transcript_4594/g.12431  ORF Transcript_4594/g.12431 Transcript_4594/m.12431 type:complete len:84 (+) Transcript_4594:2050-2301(+)